MKVIYHFLVLFIDFLEKKNIKRYLEKLTGDRRSTRKKRN